ncbi:unnamed protein product [Angiostrongylus costaricensis]|uniref:ANF_receptor domain-containing protein n=1 Tax=Angiostrongylus costaricensis TaxID=334426 RepID=A0A158PHR5_ANGCS|nr:unnamed protein product [Angiostrongylus costaricensis]
MRDDYFVAAIISGIVAKSLNFPIVVWATPFSSTLLNTIDYPTLMSPTFSSINQARTLTRLFQRYGWSDVAVISYAIRGDAAPRCTLIVDDLQKLDDNNHNITIIFHRELKNFNKDTLKNMLRTIRKMTRIIVVCIETAEGQRELMISIAEEGMDTSEYMWLMIETGRKGFGQVWKDTKMPPDGKDDLALRAARSFFVIDRIPLNASAEFVDNVKTKMREPPYNCTNCDDIDLSTSQVGELGDSMLLYAIALNRSIAAGLPNPTGSELVNFAKGSFQGFSGTVNINEKRTRDPLFLVYGLDSNDMQIIMMKITEQLMNTSTSLIQDLQPASVIWANHGGSPPLNRPLCDYDGSACPPSFTEKYLAITLVAVIVPVFVVILAVAFGLRFSSILPLSCRKRF